ncbi:component of SufBCD complex [Gymnodinialimonas ceratoperidinii]|uniref:Component of SufBCD complex n=1 Tax=Gymnodinialimonas ceratoperidinii TaxID=2856823 RepID=A0A8F6TTS9_9RHOB|nr:component of SufBCD complex [Gymnodinialimonas ceratoperidinii]QXT38338.1 component of SufBCD complex [Gymnodinialimonas ceratoperidinii]
MVREIPPACLLDLPLDFLDLLTEVINLRSFSNLWYWIVLAILWSSLSHWTVGVPFSLVARARRGDPQAEADMLVLARMNAERNVAYSETSGIFATAFSTFLLTGLAITGWGYGVEFCQAIFLLLCPSMIVVALAVWTSQRLKADDYQHVSQMLRQHRLIVQLLGVVFIFITAFWGMYQNVNVGPLG